MDLWDKKKNVLFCKCINIYYLSIKINKKELYTLFIHIGITLYTGRWKNFVKNTVSREKNTKYDEKCA